MEHLVHWDQSAAYTPVPAVCRVTTLVEHGHLRKKFCALLCSPERDVCMLSCGRDVVYLHAWSQGLI